MWRVNDRGFWVVLAVLCVQLGAIMSRIGDFAETLRDLGALSGVC